MRNFCKVMNLEIIGSVFAINGNPELKKNELVKLGNKIMNKDR